MKGFVNIVADGTERPRLEETYSVVGQRGETLSYPPLGVEVADHYICGEENEEAEEDGPFDDDASLDFGQSV